MYSIEDVMSRVNMEPKDYATTYELCRVNEVNPFNKTLDEMVKLAQEWSDRAKAVRAVREPYDEAIAAVMNEIEYDVNYYVLIRERVYEDLLDTLDLDGTEKETLDTIKDCVVYISNQLRMESFMSYIYLKEPYHGTRVEDYAQLCIDEHGFEVAISMVQDFATEMDDEIQ